MKIRCSRGNFEFHLWKLVYQYIKRSILLNFDNNAECVVLQTIGSNVPYIHIIHRVACFVWNFIKSNFWNANASEERTESVLRTHNKDTSKRYIYFETENGILSIHSFSQSVVHSFDEIIPKRTRSGTFGKLKVETRYSFHWTRMHTHTHTSTHIWTSAKIFYKIKEKLTVIFSNVLFFVVFIIIVIAVVVVVAILLQSMVLRISKVFRIL